MQELISDLDCLDANRVSDKWQFGEEELSWVPPDYKEFCAFCICPHARQ